MNAIRSRRASSLLGPRRKGFLGAACAAALSLGLSACGGGGEGGEGEGPAAPLNLGGPPPQAPPAHIVGGFSLELPPVELDPGQELKLCFLAPLDIMGPSRVIGGGVLTVTEGMHHGNISTRAKSGDGLRACPSWDDGLPALNASKGGAILFGSSTQVSGSEWQTLPDGMGFRVPEEQEIAAQMHYLNPTGERITVAPKYEWFAIDEASVTQRVGPFAWRAAGFEVQPKSELTFSSSCRLPAPMKIIHAMPHMHRLGVALTASYLGGPRDGDLFLKSAGYDPESGVMLAYDPPVDLGQGDGASFTCTWRNTLNKTIVEGFGDDEMCILFGYAYPPENAYTVIATGPDLCAVIAPPADP